MRKSGVANEAKLRCAGAFEGDELILGSRLIGLRLTYDPTHCSIYFKPCQRSIFLAGLVATARTEVLAQHQLGAKAGISRPRTSQKRPRARTNKWPV